MPRVEVLVHVRSDKIMRESADGLSRNDAEAGMSAVKNLAIALQEGPFPDLRKFKEHSLHMFLILSNTFGV